MGKIAVVTDSTADLPPDQLEDYDIKMVPLQVAVAGEEYLDWVEIGPEDFLNKLEETEEMPSTSQPSIGEFIDLYKELATDYEAIVSIHFSSKMSGTMETAKLAADMVEEAEIEVIDSKLVTAPLGIMVREVAKAAQEGASLEEIKELVDKLKNQIEIYFTIDELDYLEKGGRIGKATAFLGNLFKVRPLLTIKEGEITPCKKVRGEKRLYRDFSKLIGKELKGDTGKQLVILYGRYQDKAKKLKEILTTDYNWERVEIWRFGAIVGSHIGPTPFGAIVYN